MDRESTLRLINEIFSVHREGDAESDELIRLLEKKTGDPEVWNFFTERQYDGWTAEQILDAALAKKPILL